MKKLISILLCLSIVFGVVAFTSQAEEAEIRWDGDPVIFIQGFMGPPLIKDKGLETEETILGPGGTVNIAYILAHVPQLLTGLLIHIFGGSDDMLIDGFASLAADKMDKMSCNEDGTSKYNISTYPFYVEESSVAALKEAGKEDYIPEKSITGDILEVVPEDSLFVFNSDWRMAQITNADRLASFVDDVLELTGKTKVDIYALSHGGQLAATYLYYYGTQAKVDNALLNVPAIGGTTIATGLLNGETKFDMDQISRFAEVLLHTETDLRWLGKILPGDFLNGLISAAFSEVFLPLALNYGCIWDFLPMDTYPEFKEKYLNNPLIHGERIALHDKMHYDCMANMSKGLKAAQDAGVNIYIMANYGTKLGTGEAIDSDFVIDTSSTSGAYTAEPGKHFSASYSPKRTTCSDPTHNHISPCRTVDAGCAYLPENTWFIKDQYHGQIYWDDYTRPLIKKMLLTDDIKDIYSDPDYPQFELAQNPVDALYVRFTNEASGYFNSDSSKLLIRNTSKEYSLVVTKIKTDNFTFELDKLGAIAPGEEIEIPCTKTGNANFFEMEVTYKRSGEILSSPFTKSFWFSAA